MQLVQWNMDRGPTHEDLSMAALEAFARSIRSVLSGSKLPEARQRQLVEDIVWTLASVFEDGKMTLADKRYGLRLGFVTELGEPVRVEGKFSLRDYVQGMVEQAYNDDPEHGFTTRMA